MGLDRFNTKHMFLNSLADRIAEKMKVKDKTVKELTFEYENTHYILHRYSEKWIVSYPYTDKYWFEYIEEKPPTNLDDIISELNRK